MNVLIIEDELLAFKRLSKLIKEVEPDAVIIGHVESIAAARQWFANNPPPFLTFCDIHLSDGSALELLDERVATSPVIVTTAYDQYALHTFNTDAIAYLLKPVQKNLLEEAMQKATRLGNMLNAKTDPESAEIKTEPGNYKTRFMVRFNERIKLLMVEDIAYIYAENKTTFARAFNGKTHPLDQNLDAIERTLDPQRFFRLNRQYIINIKAIGEMWTHTKARVVVQLNPPAKEAPIVSSEKAAEFKQWLADELH
jgi:DNA-binding LytR/AlgR family response regulator